MATQPLQHRGLGRRLVDSRQARACYVAYYRDVLGFDMWQHFDDKDISTEYTALKSVVMANHSRSIKFPINEPAEGKRKSQIEEYLDYYLSPGAQHLAIITGDIIKTVDELRRRTAK